jgi:hypothetical protein
MFDVSEGRTASIFRAEESLYNEGKTVFVVDKVALGYVYLQVLGFPL